MSKTIPRGGGGLTDSDSESEPILNLTKIKLLQGCFQHNTIEFMKNVVNDRQMTLSQFCDNLLLFVPEIISNAQMEELCDNAKTITYLFDNYAQEYEDTTFASVPLKQHSHTVYSLGHGNINTKYNEETGNPEFSVLYAENLAQRISSLKTTSITNETAAGCSSYHYASYSAELEKIGKSKGTFSHQTKEDLRNLQKTNLEEYVKKIENDGKILQKRINDDDDDDVDYDDMLNEKDKQILLKEIQKYKKITDEINKILKPSDKGKSKLLKTYSKDSLEILNTQFSSKMEKDIDQISSFGIIYIPHIKTTVPKDIVRFINHYLSVKSISSDSDSYYYNKMLFDLQSSSINPALTSAKIIDFIDYCITKRNTNYEYAFCIYKYPNNKYGSLAYEIVKQYIAQTNSEDMKLLFYANFCFDNLTFSTSQTVGKTYISRISNNNEKLLEMITLLELMSCCGPHDLINSSCMTTAINETQVIEQMSKYGMDTQNTQYTQSDVDYLFGTQTSTYSPISTPAYSPALRLEDLETTPPRRNPVSPALRLEDLETSPPRRNPVSPALRLEDLETSPPASPLVIPSTRNVSSPASSASPSSPLSPLVIPSTRNQSPQSPQARKTKKFKKGGARMRKTRIRK